jgi:hypothetical protein
MRSREARIRLRAMEPCASVPRCHTRVLTLPKTRSLLIRSSLALVTASYGYRSAPLTTERDETFTDSPLYSPMRVCLGYGRFSTRSDVHIPGSSSKVGELFHPSPLYWLS